MSKASSTPIHKVAFIGSHSPRKCGIASFTSDLAQAVHESGVQCRVVAMDDRPESYNYPEIVGLALQQHDSRAYPAAAEYLNSEKFDVVCVQHEFGIFGGPAGCRLLDLLRELKMPIVTTMHTILQRPNKEQREVVMELSQLSDRLVVMSRKGREILEETYSIFPKKIAVVPHGIPVVEDRGAGSNAARQILTFGLIGPSKGIENMILALPAIVEEHPDVTYIVAGATHPHILETRGEEYRESLVALAEERGVSKHVKFVNEFLTLSDLTSLLRSATIYVTPYLNREQITSGTLAYAFGCGNAVVSTPYWHAEELLAGSRGLLVPFADANALAQAINGLLGDPVKLETIQRNAYELGRSMQWPVIGQRYSGLFAEVCGESRRMVTNIIQSVDAVVPSEVSLEHLLAMTDDVGLIQHAKYSIPNRHEGYCTDDNARAAILAVRLQGIIPPDRALDLQRRYLAFLVHAFNEDNGRIRNFLSYGREWLEEQGSEESHGRALYALGVMVAESDFGSVRAVAKEIFDRALPAVQSFNSIRAWCNVILGLECALVASPSDPERLGVLKDMSLRLHHCYREFASPDWPWFEDALAYDNAKVPQAMLAASRILDDELGKEIGLKSLTWLAEIQKTSDGLFYPIGCEGLGRNGERLHSSDQQPIEVSAMVEACAATYRATGGAYWREESSRAYAWFLGANSAGVPVCDPARGACKDAVTTYGVNGNEGAESTLAYLSSLSTVIAMKNEVVAEGAYLG